MPTVHVIGTGLAGLSAALHLSEAGTQVRIWEATARAGGRAWSFHDDRLGGMIDNGNHLVLSGNRAVLDHCRRIGTFDRLDISPEAAFPFHDLATGAGWSLRVPSLRAPRVALPPGTGAGALRDLARIMTAGNARTVAETVRPGTSQWHALWEPLSLAVLNAPPEEASAGPLAAVLARTILRGGQSCRPVFMPDGLGPTLVDPALDILEGRGVSPEWRAPLTGITAENGRVSALHFASRSVALGPSDGVILAVPSVAAGRLLGRAAPRAGRAILNAHFRVETGMASALPPFIGLLSGQAQWVFRRGDMVSVTVSAAAHVPKEDRGKVLAALWSEVARAAGCSGAQPIASRLIAEKTATFSPEPSSLAARLPHRPLLNVAVAGDHAASPLPATLEGAIASGQRAAREIISG